MEKWKESSSKSYEGMQEVEKIGWIKAERRWNSKLYHDKKWQALMNHCSHNCLGSNGCEMFKIWLNRLKYKSPLKAAACCNRFEHARIGTQTSLSIMC